MVLEQLGIFEVLFKRLTILVVYFSLALTRYLVLVLGFISNPFLLRHCDYRNVNDSFMHSVLFLYPPAVSFSLHQ